MIEEILAGLSVLPQVSKDNFACSAHSFLKKSIKADNEWDNFITHFEEVNQGFLNSLKLKHPTLTINDIRYISYILHEFKHQRNCINAKHYAKNRVEKRKERVLSKMQLAKDTNLYDYLTSL